ncbi:MAG: hypothetical protein KBC81_01280 [Candidatus Pacebacteria bacterium]|nr:hypothetical protein [Candidatus Paceibacterota bacterium]
MSKPVEYLGTRLNKWLEAHETVLSGLGWGAVYLWAGIFLSLIFVRIFTYGTRFEDPTWAYLVYIGITPIFVYAAFLMLCMIGLIVWVIDEGLTEMVESIRGLFHKSAAN